MNFILHNGTVYEPMSHTFQKKDIGLKNNQIADPAALKSAGDTRSIDAEGCLILPGLIDYHTHYYFRGSENGVNPDASSFCMGITTAVDGGTCGVGDYELYHNTIMAASQVRILSYLLMASGGQSNDQYPENLDPQFFEKEKILDFFQKYSGELVALKTRLSSNIISPELARKSLKRTVEIAEKAHTRVVVHVTDCSLPLEEVAAMLRPGDVICHIYQNRGSHTCLGPDGKIFPGLWAAKKRGILFDACNGRSNFDLETARAAIAQGFLPDIISSDNNCSSWFLQPMHTLPRILSKFLDLGMKLEDILDCATKKPAKLIGHPELGTLEEGTPADIAVFKLKKKEVPYTDINGHTMRGQQILVPQMTFKDGQCVYCQADFQ